MSEIISEITWQNFITGLSVIFGIITLVAYIEQKRSNNAQKRVIEFINRQLDRDITQEEIESLQSKKDILNQDITEKLPILAYKSILLDQLDFYQERLNNNFLAIKEIELKLKNIEINTPIEKISNEIRDYVINMTPSINKDYLFIKSRDRIIGLLAIIFTIDIILPFSLDYYIKIALGIVLFPEVIKYFILNTKNIEDRKSIYKQVKYGLYITGFSFFLFILNIIYFNWESFYKENTTQLILIIVIANLGLILVLFSKKIVSILSKRIEHNITKSKQINAYKL